MDQHTGSGAVCREGLALAQCSAAARLEHIGMNKKTLVGDRAVACPVDALRRWLQSRQDEPVVVKETHISWVLLTRRLAIKLKKPVRLAFLDFGTPARRRHYCEEELRLNRRLAPSLYRKVLPVCGSPDAPRLGGTGVPIDHVLCMRRFPDGALLSEMLSCGRLLPSHIDRFACRLADFHEQVPVCRGAHERARHPIFPVIDGLEAMGAVEEGERLRTWATAQALVLKDHWEHRWRTGAVRECHGDLHLENVVVLGRHVTAFDCAEFDPALRRIDVMSDLAFTTMDLRARGRPDMAYRLLDGYLQRRGDFDGLRGLRFEEVYRALVRSMVARMASSPVSDGPDYAACARLLISGATCRGRLLITCGLSGSGKSTLASQLLEAAGAVRVRSDVERKRLFGLNALQPSGGLAVDLYDSNSSRATYERLACCARIALEAGYPVIVDAAFLRREQRRIFQALAERLSVPFGILDCQAGLEVLKERVAARERAGRDASEATVDVLVDQLAHRDVLDPEERKFALVVDTDGPIDITALRERWRAASTAGREE